MNELETALLVRTVRATCPAQKIDEYTPDAWYRIFARQPVQFSLAEGEDAVAALGATMAFIAPSDIVQHVGKARTGRVQRAPMPCPNDNPGVSEGDEIRAIQRAMAEGRITNLAEAYAYERWGGSMHLAYQRQELPALEGPEPAGDPDRVRKAIAPAFGRVPRAQ